MEERLWIICCFMLVLFLLVCCWFGICLFVGVVSGCWRSFGFEFVCMFCYLFLFFDSFLVKGLRWEDLI